MNLDWALCCPVFIPICIRKADYSPNDPYQHTQTHKSRRFELDFGSENSLTNQLNLIRVMQLAPSLTEGFVKLPIQFQFEIHGNALGNGKRHFSRFMVLSELYFVMVECYNRIYSIPFDIWIWTECSSTWAHFYRFCLHFSAKKNRFNGAHFGAIDETWTKCTV